MFFHLQLERNITLEPKHFGARMREVLEAKLKHEVEGSCTGRHGFIVLVTRLASVGEGKITTDGTARATFHIKYDCIAFRPFKGEVLDAVVTQVNKFGFFAEAGPLQLFVSNALITEDMKFDSSGENCYVSDDQQIRIQRDCEVRVRIVGMRIDANDIFCIATIKDDYLGLIGFSSAQDGMEL